MGWWPESGEENEELMLKGCGVSVSQTKKQFMKMDGGGCTALYMDLMPLNYVFQMVKMVNFRFCVFYHNFC